MSGATDESLRQRALLAGIAGSAGDAAAARLRAPQQPGLRAYRANAQASAVRALRAACPRVVEMLGGTAFDAMALAFRQAHAPQRGDLGEWGDALPGWLANQPTLADWPWLADAARLDLALHHCERAADAAFDAASLHALASTEPARLHVRLMPGTRLLESAWPVALLFRAHAGPAVDDAALDAARQALAERRGEAVLVARQGWRAKVHDVAAADLPWLRAILAGQDLGSALDAAGPGFDFTVWLQNAIVQGVLQSLHVADG